MASIAFNHDWCISFRILCLARLVALALTLSHSHLSVSVCAKSRMISITSSMLLTSREATNTAACASNVFGPKPSPNIHWSGLSIAYIERYPDFLNDVSCLLVCESNWSRMGVADGGLVTHLSRVAYCYCLDSCQIPGPLTALEMISQPTILA